MNAQAPVPADHPLMAAWEAYKASEGFANTRRWALHEQHVDGSLWAAFMSGWRAAGGDTRFWESADEIGRRIAAETARGEAPDAQNDGGGYHPTQNTYPQGSRPSAETKP